MVLQSLLFAGGVVLGFGLMTLLPRWMQVLLIGCGLIGAAVVLSEAASRLDGGLLLGGLMLVAGLVGLDRILVSLRRPMVSSPSGQAPGGAHAPGEAGERDGERDAPNLPGIHATAGRAGRPRSFSEVSR
jgi:hypothetical protein